MSPGVYLIILKLKKGRISYTVIILMCPCFCCKKKGLTSKGGVRSVSFTSQQKQQNTKKIQQNTKRTTCSFFKYRLKTVRGTSSFLSRLRRTKWLVISTITRTIRTYFESLSPSFLSE